ncbi:uncharacterized protein LOC104907647 [Beta vulgaris subsp. vulgaris]|uniref:uncharacterized protein LOC104907647 n=1 Tax=Beta vulgaris subsp. vulgaris TaxID=3555 RepID=UPI00053FBE9F|nr:uncharacterized protein LOC104907647 [Beta vulgaris subsp. vulgaris]
MDFEKEDLKTVPIWVQLRLNLKYWGEKSLHKIASQIGDPIKRDEATRNKDKLQYARILIEVKIEQEWPDHVNFWNELGELTHVPIVFEWRPTQCQQCKGIGHTTQGCKSKKVQQMWAPKQAQMVTTSLEKKVSQNKVSSEVVLVVAEDENVKEIVDPDDFQKALKPIKVRNSRSATTITLNHFQPLHPDNTENVNEQQADKIQGGGEPPYPDG